jgi:DNA-binding response OmpR family regulator
MYTVMIVEDDRALCMQLAEGLQKWRFNVTTAQDFEHVVTEFGRHQPQLVVMDVNLPCFDGFYWTEQIRKISKVPVLFLSSRDNNMDIVMAVNAGADDYVTKPFAMSVLIAKVQALLRRSYDYAAGTPELLSHHDLTLNTGDGTVFYNGQRIELTKNEHKNPSPFAFQQGGDCLQGKIDAAAVG